MNWIKENQFLAGFFAVLLIGVGVLGWLLFTAMGSYDEARAGYQQKAGELTKLQNLPLTPNQKNLNALIAQKKEAIDAVAAFQASLAAKSFPLDKEMKPEKFQDTLKTTKTAVEQAAKNATELPPKFFLGFDSPERDYTASLPAPAAAPPLARQLKAIEWVLLQLFENRVTKLEALKRQELPEESGKKPEPTGKKTGAGSAPPAQRLVSTHSFEIKMRCQQRALSGVLNALTGPKAPQFYIPRVVQVKNEKERVPRVDPKAPVPGFDVPPPPAGAFPEPPGAAPAAPVPPPAPPKPVAAYIVGDEQLEVTLVIDIVDFAEPTPVPAK